MGLPPVLGPSASALSASPPSAIGDAGAGAIEEELLNERIEKGNFKGGTVDALRNLLVKAITDAINIRAYLTCCMLHVNMLHAV